MILIFGGAYQGKLEYALTTFDRTEEQVHTCERSTTLPETPAVLYKLEDFVYACTEAGLEAREILASHKDDLKNTIFIATDVSQGLVPMEATDRAFREMMGRTLLYLTKEAEQVHRVFCGLGQRLK